MTSRSPRPSVGPAAGPGVDSRPARPVESVCFSWLAVSAGRVGRGRGRAEDRTPAGVLEAESEGAGGGIRDLHGYKDG